MVPASMARIPNLANCAALAWSQGTDATDLNADGAEVGEATQRESGDGEGTWIKKRLHRSELSKGDEFVDRHARAQQIANLRRVVPRDADQPRHRSKYPAEHSLQAFWEPGHVRPAMDSTHHGVQQRQQRDERDEHCANIERELQPIACASCDGAQNIRLLLHGGHFDASSGQRLFGFRDQHFRHQQRAGSGHDYRGQQILGVGAAHLNVAGHHAAGDVRHAAGHHAP